jgi:hypothetical protein
MTCGVGFRLLNASPVLATASFLATIRHSSSSSTAVAFSFSPSLVWHEFAFISLAEHNNLLLNIVLFRNNRKRNLTMEKYTDSTSPSQDGADFENAALLNTNYMKQETQRRRNYLYVTLFNLFIFTLSMLSMICAVMSQKDTSSYSAAKLMDQFGIFCMHKTDSSQSNEH